MSNSSFAPDLTPQLSSINGDAKQQLPSEKKSSSASSSEQKNTLTIKLYDKNKYNIPGVLVRKGSATVNPYFGSRNNIILLLKAFNNRTQNQDFFNQLITITEYALQLKNQSQPHLLAEYDLRLLAAIAAYKKKPDSFSAGLCDLLVLVDNRQCSYDVLCSEPEDFEEETRQERVARLRSRAARAENTYIVDSYYGSIANIVDLMEASQGDIHHYNYLMTVARFALEKKEQLTQYEQRLLDLIKAPSPTLFVDLCNLVAEKDSEEENDDEHLSNRRNSDINYEALLRIVNIVRQPSNDPQVQQQRDAQLLALFDCWDYMLVDRGSSKENQEIKDAVMKATFRTIYPSLNSTEIDALIVAFKKEVRQELADMPRTLSRLFLKPSFDDFLWEKLALKRQQRQTLRDQVHALQVQEQLVRLIDRAAFRPNPNDLNTSTVDISQQLRIASPTVTRSITPPSDSLRSTQSGGDSPTTPPTPDSKQQAVVSVNTALVAQRAPLRSYSSFGDFSRTDSNSPPKSASTNSGSEHRQDQTLTP